MLTESMETYDYVERAREGRRKSDEKKKHLYHRHSRKLKALDIEAKVWEQHSHTKKWNDTAIIISRIP